MNVEGKIQSDVMRALGALPDLRIFRNTVGTAATFNSTTGKTQYVTYGLGTGSPDLVGMLTVSVFGHPFARWFCLEIKRPGASPRPEQVQWAKAARLFGCFATHVTSVDEALAAVERARKGAYE